MSYRFEGIHEFGKMIHKFSKNTRSGSLKLFQENSFIKRNFDYYFFEIV